MLFYFSILFSVMLSLLAPTSEKQSLELFYKKSVLKHFAKFTGRHFCQSSHLGLPTLFKKRLWNRCFPANFAKFLRTPILKNICEWLPLTSIFFLPIFPALLQLRLRKSPSSFCVLVILSSFCLCNSDSTIFDARIFFSSGTSSLNCSNNWSFLIADEFLET